MDVSSILSMFETILMVTTIMAVLIIIATFIAIKYTSPSHIGSVGEKIIAERLNMVDGYKKIINGIMINDNGKSRQIDHIAITERGVFVIETKNYSGTIYGKETSTQWKQYLQGKPFAFRNPIHQNYGHLEIVKANIKDITDKIYPVIVFIGRCKLKVETTSVVLYHNQVVEYINNSTKCLNNETIDNIYNRIMENKVTNKEAIKHHNNNVKKYIEYKENIAKDGRCPRCEGELIKRHGRNGDFYGCKNYPKCKYTRDSLE